MLKFAYMVTIVVAGLVGLALVVIGFLLLSEANAVFQEIEAIQIIMTGIILLALTPIYFMATIFVDMLNQQHDIASKEMTQNEMILNNLRVIREGMAADFALRQKPPQD